MGLFEAFALYDAFLSYPTTGELLWEHRRRANAKRSKSEQPVTEPNQPIEVVADTAPCANCGKPRNQHWLVNYSDGPLIGKGAMMCPTAQFAAREQFVERESKSHD